MVPDFRRDDVWMPPYQVRGGLLKSGMTEKAVYGQALIIYTKSEKNENTSNRDIIKFFYLLFKHSVRMV
jgi:hypothetical protein